MMNDTENQVRECSILGKQAASGVFGVWVWNCGPLVQSHSDESTSQSTRNLKSLVLGQPSASGVAAIWTWESGSTKNRDDDDRFCYPPAAAHKPYGKWVWNSGSGSYYDDDDEIDYKAVSARQRDDTNDGMSGKWVWNSGTGSHYDDENDMVYVAISTQHPSPRNADMEERKYEQKSDMLASPKHRPPRTSPRKAALVTNEKCVSPKDYRRLRKKLLAEARVVRE